MTESYSPVNQTPSGHIAANFHPEYQTECPECPAETGERGQDKFAWVSENNNMKSQVAAEIQYWSHTLTISEPSISFSLERLSLILSGWARHFNRSSISPGDRRGQAEIY